LNIPLNFHAGAVGLAMHAPDAPALPADPIAAASHPVPYGYYQRLRERTPLYFDTGLNLWVASSHAGIAEALVSPALRVRPASEPVPRALVGGLAGEVFANLVRMNDGTFHAAHKPYLQQRTQRWTLGQVTRASAEATRELRPLLDANDFLTALPARVMACLLGVPDPQLQQTTQWAQDFSAGIAGGASAQAVDRAHAAAAGLLAQGTAQGLDAAQAANRIALMQQSLDATAGLLGNTVHLLRQRPEMAERIVAAPGLTRELVAEVVRWDAPVQNTRRFAAQGLRLCGASIREGEGLLLVLASANRDPALNPDPDRFEVRRQQRRNLTFGAGVHACPAEQIAIEITASCIDTIRGKGQIDAYFGRILGYRSLPNVRIPVFASSSASAPSP
jgi:cytochrome P450